MGGLGACIRRALSGWRDNDQDTIVTTQADGLLRRAFHAQLRRLGMLLVLGERVALRDMVFIFWVKEYMAAPFKVSAIQKVPCMGMGYQGLT